MKPSLYIVFIFIVVTLSLQSCYTAYNIQSINMPCFEDEKEVKIGGSYGNAGFDINTAISLDKDFGIMLNGSFYNRGTDTISSIKSSYAEVALGYLFLDDARNGPVPTSTEVFIGVGRGTTQAYNDYWSEYYASGSYTKAFIQIDGYNIHDWFRDVAGFRYSYVHFNTFSDDPLLVPERVSSRNTSFIELYGSRTIRTDNLDVIFTAGYIYPTSVPDFSYSFITGSIGLSYTFRENPLPPTRRIKLPK